MDYKCQLCGSVKDIESLYYLSIEIEKNGVDKWIICKDCITPEITDRNNPKQIINFYNTPTLDSNKMLHEFKEIKKRISKFKKVDREKFLTLAKEGEMIENGWEQITKLFKIPENYILHCVKMLGE